MPRSSDSDIALRKRIEARKRSQRIDEGRSTISSLKDESLVPVEEEATSPVILPNEEVQDIVEEIPAGANAVSESPTGVVTEEEIEVPYVKYTKIPRLTRSPRQRAPVSIIPLVDTLSRGNFDYESTNPELIEAFVPTHDYVGGGRKGFFENAIKPVVVESTNRVLGVNHDKTPRSITPEEASKALRVRKEPSPAAFGFKPNRIKKEEGTRKVKVKKIDGVVQESSIPAELKEEEPPPPEEKGTKSKPVIEEVDIKGDRPAEQEKLNKIHEQNVEEKNTRRRNQFRTTAKYGLGGAGLALLAYLAYRQYKKHKKNKRSVKKAEDSSGAWIKAPASAVRDFAPSYFYSIGPGRLFKGISEADTPEKQLKLNSEMPQLWKDTVDWTFKHIQKSDRPNAVAGAAQTFDRFSAAPGGELAKPLRKNMPVNAVIYDPSNPAKTGKGDSVYDPRKSVFRGIAAALASPYGVPYYDTTLSGSPFFLGSPAYDDNGSASPFLIADSANMYGDDPMAKFWPNIANIGYRMPALVGEYASRWTDEDPNKIYDLDDRKALVKGTLASLPSRYPSVRNLASAVVNGGFGKWDDLQKVPQHYKTDGNKILMEGSRGYEKSPMEEVYRGGLWDYDANAFNPMGTNYVLEAASAVNTPRVPVGALAGAKAMRAQDATGSFYDDIEEAFGTVNENVDPADREAYKDYLEAELALNHWKKVELDWKTRLQGLESGAPPKFKDDTVEGLQARIAWAQEHIDEAQSKISHYRNDESSPLYPFWQRRNDKLRAAGFDPDGDDPYNMSTASLPGMDYFKSPDGQPMYDRLITDDDVTRALMDDEYTEEAKKRTAQEMFELFDELGPYIFQKDTVSGPQMIFANPGGLLSDALSAYQDNIGDYSGRLDQVKEILDKATAGASDNLGSAIFDEK